MVCMSGRLLLFGSLYIAFGAGVNFKPLVLQKNEAGRQHLMGGPAPNVDANVIGGFFRWHVF